MLPLLLLLATALDLDRRSADEVREHLESMELPPGFSAVIEPPFVVIGDEDPPAVQQHARGTVRWAVSRLREFFPRDPDRVLEIWLFRDKESYQQNVARRFGDRPETPFGYYSPRHRALIMNISTGGGTLVHELVHPLMEANFPGCPPWFNEGLGSLFEQSSEREGKIVGLTNWRLPGLKEAIKKGTLPSFAALMKADGETFYGDGSPTRYAEARYLLYYLQSRGYLGSFYRTFHTAAARGQDDSGLSTLRAILGEDDLVAFQRRWERFVLELEFNG